MNSAAMMWSEKFFQFDHVASRCSSTSSDETRQIESSLLLEYESGQKSNRSQCYRAIRQVRKESSNAEIDFLLVSDIRLVGV